MEERLSKYGSSLATMMVGYTIYQHYFPSTIRDSIDFITSHYSTKLYNYFSPYLDITFDEYSDHRFIRSEVYTIIQNYLCDKCSSTAKSMRADYVEDGKSLLLKMGENEEIVDCHNGVQVWWSFHIDEPSQPSYQTNSSEKRYYTLVFQSKHRKFILDTYLPYVLGEGEAIAAKQRRRKLFTNAGHGDFVDLWIDVDFNHPASFEMLAMENSKKQMILEDLAWFKSAKDYYAQIGKPWKRGYLLYGPPGTGKSTLVASMANFLAYDIYDLELTSVKKNMHLRSLLMETNSKSIILIEDIDCSLDLTGQRKTAKKKSTNEEEEKDPILESKDKDHQGEKKSEVTLSGLLNFIDGIWSCCGEERIIVFTTNHIDKLDPALIRSGRMDVHIELSYCGYDAFKVLAKNYLKIETHPLFESIQKLLEETNVTPADVAENLMPRSLRKTSDEACLKNLIIFLEKAKQENMLKCEQEIVLQE